MKKYLSVLLVIIVVAVIFAVPAHAGWGWIEKVASWGIGALVAAGVTFVLGIGVVAKYTNWLSGILVPAGFFLVTVGNALDDGKITREELKEMKEKFSIVRAAARNRP